MKTLKERLIGKKIQNLEYKGGNWILSFTDGSGISFYTDILLNFDCRDDNLITGCKDFGQKLRLHVGEESIISINTNCKNQIGPEAFVFQDTDGVFIVENGN